MEIYKKKFLIGFGGSIIVAIPYGFIVDTLFSDDVFPRWGKTALLSFIVMGIFTLAERWLKKQENHRSSKQND
ncbi:MAG: hypothetical protein SOV83_04475 [Prevotella sp.]|nr:hypothetical protein [Prevotella sp.]